MPSNVVVLENSEQNGRRSLHLMADQPLGKKDLEYWAWSPEPVGFQMRVEEDELRFHHLKATWLAREPMVFTFGKWGDDKRRPMVVWAISPTPGPSPFAVFANGEGRTPRISEAMVDAALMFYGRFGFWPSYAWVKTWPKGLNRDDAFVQISDGIAITLLDAPWAFDGFVIVGGEFNCGRHNGQSE